MEQEEWLQLSKYRYEKSLNELKAADVLFNAEAFNQTVNRSYYAIFSAMRSVNALDHFESKKHSGVRSHFIQYHVKNGDFNLDASYIINYSHIIREESDYKDYYDASKEDALKLLTDAKKFVEYTKEFLTNNKVIKDENLSL